MGCSGTTARGTEQSTVLLAAGDTREPPALRETPLPAHSPASAGTGTAMPPSPALGSWDTPVLTLLERGPGRLGTWDRVGAGQEHPAPHHPAAWLASPSPRGGVKPTFIGGLAIE